MPLDTFENLKATVVSWSRRGDLKSEFEDFLDLAETEMTNNPLENLKLREMNVRSRATLPTTDRYIALPDGFIRMLSLSRIIDGGTSGDDLFVPLSFRQLNQFVGQDITGTPTQFKVGSQIQFNRIPELAEDIEMEYWADFAPLTSTNTSNTVLTNNPNVYLFGCLKFLHRRGQDTEEEGIYDKRFMEAIQGANKKTKEGQFGPRGRIIPRGRKP